MEQKTLICELTILLYGSVMSWLRGHCWDLIALPDYSMQVRGTFVELLLLET